MSGLSEDSLGAVLDEVAEVFRFETDSRPQDRAHVYLRRHAVCHGFDDTAMQCAATDMVRRAYACGMADAGGAFEHADGNESAENGPSCTETGRLGAESGIEVAESPIRCAPAETVDDPAWYTFGAVETIDKVEAVVDGLPAVPAFLLGQVVRYVDRAGRKDDAEVDLGKANNYAHRLVGGKWRDHE